MNSKEGLTRGNFRLFFSSEIDGIKMIGVGRD